MCSEADDACAKARVIGRPFDLEDLHMARLTKLFRVFRPIKDTVFVTQKGKNNGYDRFRYRIIQ